METNLNGEIFQGTFDSGMNEFVLTQVKEMSTQTVLNEKQIDVIYHYLSKVNDGRDQFVTLYDQLPLRLTNEEVNILLHELKNIKTMFGNELVN